MVAQLRAYQSLTNDHMDPFDLGEDRTTFDYILVRLEKDLESSGAPFHL